MTLQIDFIRDVAARCTERLDQAGYTIQPGDDEDAIRAYVSIRYRRVRPRSRRVHKAAYTVPPHLAAGEQQLIAKVEAGGDLWPHQSRQIERADFEDGMLNDYGIQHFHLGTGPDRNRPNLMQGTKEVLFAVVRDDDFYVIGIDDHSAWTRQAMLDVIRATWPELLDPYTLTDGPNMKIKGLRHNYTDEQVKKLRAAGVNTLQQRSDGSITSGMGGGITTNGKSMAVTRETDRFVEHAEALQEAVVAVVEPHVASGDLPPDASVRVIWDGDKVFAVSEPPVVKVDISDKLVIPPL